MQNLSKRIGVVILFAIAMAWVESAVVVYLRGPVDRIIPYQPDPLPALFTADWIEVAREAATMVMLFTVGWLAGQTWHGRLGYSFLIFGAWDIFYYVFLRLMCGWPQSLLDWDLLFLIPLPWWGPVISPMLIAGLFVIGGILAAISERRQSPVWPRGWVMILSIAGAGLALYAFMEAALKAAGQGEQVIRQVLPTTFNWPMYAIGVLLMAAPIIDMGRQLRQAKTKG